MNRSGRSWQVSDCERFPQVAHDKWANEQIACFFRVNRSFTLLLTKTSDSLIFLKLKSYFLVYFLYFFFLKKTSDSLIPSFLMSDVSESLKSLTKISDVSKLLRSLTINEQPWVICSGRSPKMSDHEQSAQVAHQKWVNERIAHFSQKRAICSKNRWAKSHPCRIPLIVNHWLFSGTSVRRWQMMTS